MNKVKKITMTCLILILVVGFSAFSVLAGDNLQVLKSGIENYYQGEYEKALTILNKDIENENIDKELKVNILYYRTLSQIKLYKIVEAKNTINYLADMGYEFAYIYRKLGEVYLNKNGQFDFPFYNEARKQLEKASKLGINSTELHNDLALSYQGLNNIDKAIDEYEYILDKDESAVNYLNLASLYKEKGKTEDAIKYFNTALEKNPVNISIYINLGDLYTKTEEYKNAIDILEKGIKLDSNFVALHYKLARSYYFNKNYDKAMIEFNKVINLNQNYYQAYYYLGELYKKKENWQQAIYSYELAVKYNNNFADAYIALGNIYLKQENYYKAIASFTSAIEKNETYPKGHYRLAVTYSKLNMKEAAIKELRNTLHLNSEHTEARKLLNKLMEE